MHLLKATPGGVQDGQEAVDLGQDPGEVVVLSAADTELANLAQARGELGDGYPGAAAGQPDAARPQHVGRPVPGADLPAGETHRGAPVGRDQLLALRRRAAADAVRDRAASSSPCCRATTSRTPTSPSGRPWGEAAYHRLWQYCVHGGPANARAFLGYAAELAGHEGFDWAEPAPLLARGLYWPGCEAAEPGRPARRLAGGCAGRRRSCSTARTCRRRTWPRSTR